MPDSLIEGRPVRVLVTGANGFVGAALCAELHERSCPVRAAVRSAASRVAGAEVAVVGAIDGRTEWNEALRGVDAVVHLAARVHVMHEAAADPLQEFRHVNVAGTERLARAAAACGVKRFVYVSSVKVNGEETSPAGSENKGAQFTELDPAAPQDSYGLSKWEAEQALHRVAEETGLEIVIVRPPLVYGPGVKGNFMQMLGALARRLPLPLASVHNRRDLVYVGNLVDALITCATHPAAAGKTYLVGDGEAVSTPELLRSLGAMLGKPARLLPCPPALLLLAGRLAGKRAQLERLLGSLQLDSSRIRHELDWTPPYTLQQGLQATAEWYRHPHP